MKANSLVFGPVGSGKSRSIRTWLKEYPDERGQWHKGAGRQVMNLSLEAGAEASHEGLTCELGFHNRTILPADVSWEVMTEWVEKLGRMPDAEAMIKQVIPPTLRSEFQQLLDIYATCNDYKCDRCGESFGGVSSWGDDRVFVNDGLSGLTEIATHFIIGPKPFVSYTLYQPIQGLIRGYLNKCVGLNCNYVLVAHWDREVNEVTREKTITIDTIGQKLAPRLLKMFDEIVVARQDSGKKFWWSTIEDGVELKCRRLPYSDDIKPDFSQLFEER